MQGLFPWEQPPLGSCGLGRRWPPDYSTKDTTQTGKRMAPLLLGRPRFRGKTCGLPSAPSALCAFGSLRLRLSAPSALCAFGSLRSSIDSEVRDDELIAIREGGDALHVAFDFHAVGSCAWNFGRGAARLGAGEATVVQRGRARRIANAALSHEQARVRHQRNCFASARRAWLSSTWTIRIFLSCSEFNCPIGI
jgi:hypothetical protein